MSSHAAGPRPHPSDESLERASFRTNAVLVLVAGFLLGLPYFVAALLGLSLTNFAALVSGELMIASLLWRRRDPRLMLMGVTGAGVLHLVAVPWPTLFLLVIPVAVYSYARWVEGHPRLVLVIGIAASVLGPLSWLPTFGYGTVGENVGFTVLLSMVCAFLVVTPYAFGRRIRDAAMVQEQREAAAGQRYLQALEQREHAARMAEVNTRAQIARELHDIVAHSVSVMIVQAEGGKALAAQKPEAAAEVLGTIAETGREALTEMRRLVGVLRGDADESAAFAPTPGLGDLASMVERAGERVRLVVHGEPPQAPPALQLTVFRVAQEGVTNFLKHAGPEAHCVVTLDQAPDWVTITVDDDGPGVDEGSDGGGHGLQGMHERVTAMGGTLVARPKHPDEGSGFLVRATFPVRAGGRQPTVGADPMVAWPASPPAPGGF